jgi:hypothetical protein
MREGQRRLVGRLDARVVRAATEQRELGALALVQELERPHPRRRRVVGHEQNRFQRTASS